MIIGVFNKEISREISPAIIFSGIETDEITEITNVTRQFAKNEELIFIEGSLINTILWHMGCVYGEGTLETGEIFFVGNNESVSEGASVEENFSNGITKPLSYSFLWHKPPR